MADAAEHEATSNESPSPTEPHDERIRRAVTRLEGTAQRRSGFGRSTDVSTTTLLDGLRCVSCEGQDAVETDLGSALGGNGTGPTPSALLRAALGSCLTMGYRLRAARHRIPIDRIRVEVETDSAVGGMLDPDSAFPPGFTELRYRVEIDSPASAEAIDRVIAEADQLSPVLDIVTRSNRATRLPSAASTEDGGR